MQTLYPSIKPYATHHIPVDDTHTIYVEESGNPDGLPVVVLHGGPGAGSSPEQRRFFDPLVYRIILLDQRGTGLSTPHAELKNNTTQDLIEDLEKIRNQLKIKRWVLFGGSWGATLSLVYAETYPENVISMILRGVFLCRTEDLAWFYQDGGANRIFPEAWEDLIRHIPKQYHDNIMQGAYQILTSQDELAQMSLAKAWAEWEGVCSTLAPHPDTVNHFLTVALSLARIETHYFVNNAFLEPNQILKNANRLANIPGHIVHGRYDMVCPFDQAYALHKVWPRSELMSVREAGHSAYESGNICALITATRRVSAQFFT